jgi:hypothetical protein
VERLPFDADVSEVFQRAILLDFVEMPYRTAAHKALGTIRFVADFGHNLRGSSDEAFDPGFGLSSEIRGWPHPLEDERMIHYFDARIDIL